MELTVNTPARDWYRETVDNNLTYWRLDYPPLSGYYAYILGKFSDFYEPGSVDLFVSRGYETKSHKAFMRFSVILTDLVFYLVPVTLLILSLHKKFNFPLKMVILFLVLVTPPFILIDHGHF